MINLSKRNLRFLFPFQDFSLTFLLEIIEKLKHRKIFSYKEILGKILKKSTIFFCPSNKEINNDGYEWFHKEAEGKK